MSAAASGPSAPFHVKRLPRTLLLAPLGAYRRLSAAFPRRCRFEPTCSAYAMEATRELGAVRGSILAVWRILRCNPWSHGGHDPLEDRRLFRSRELDA